MADLTAKRRDKLPDKSFALPQDRKYPIHDRAHGANALARARQYEDGATYAKIKDAVCKRYPDLPACG